MPQHLLLQQQELEDDSWEMTACSWSAGHKVLSGTPIPGRMLEHLDCSGLKSQASPCLFAASQLRSRITEVQKDLNLLCLLQMKGKVSGKYFISPSAFGFLPPFLPLLRPHLLHLLYVKSSKLSAELITQSPLL